MLREKILMATALVLALVFGVQTDVLAFGKKKEAKFKVRIENISPADGLTTDGNSKYPFAVSPGLWVVSKHKSEFFRVGKKAAAGLEAQAEDGNPVVLRNQLLTKVGSATLGIFNMPVGSAAAAPILPGGAYEFEFSAVEGTKFNFVAMFGQSNDLFYAPEGAFDLFVNGQPVVGDITDKVVLWDAGTEVNQAPGIGGEQAPRQKAPNTGRAEKGKVSMVNDGFSYPDTKSVLRVTITLE